jgi:DNA-binding CsgD family transcriptional regulator
MGPGASDIADLILELRNKLPDLEPPPPLDAQQTRFRLFNSIATFLNNLAQPESLVLVLEDLHWADTPSLLLLEFLAQQIAESKILVIGTYRDNEVTQQHPLGESLPRLSRSLGFHRLALSGLGSEDVGQYVRASGGENVSAELIGAIYAHTEGNPLFLSEVVRLLGEQNGLAMPAEAGTHLALGLPQGVLEAIGQRLNRLSEECVAVLTLAAVIGRQFDFGLLNNLSEDISEFKLLELVDEALEPNILQEVAGQGDRYQFSHALVQQTLLERLSTSRKVRMHARIGEELESLYGEQLGEHAAELAHHFSEASPLTGPDKLVKYSRLAGETALNGYAWEEAVRHYSMGLAAKGELANDSQYADLMFGLGRAEIGSGLVHEGWESFGKAFDYFVEAGDLARAVAVAEYPLPYTLGIINATRLTNRALEIVPHDSHEAGRLWSDLAGKLGHAENEYDRASEAFQNALSIAQRERDSMLEARIWSERAQVIFWQLQFKECIDASIRSIELAASIGDLKAELTARYWGSIAMRTIGDLKGVRDQVSDIMAAAEKLRDNFGLATAFNVASVPHLMTGDWANARRFAEEGIKILPNDTRLLSWLVNLEYQSGHLDQGYAYLERILEIIQSGRYSTPVSQAFLAFSTPAFTSISRDSEILTHQFKAAEDVIASPLTSPLLKIWARIGLSYSAFRLNDSVAARTHYSEIAPAAGRLLHLHCADRILGRLSHVMGEPQQADLHFEDALSFSRKAGYSPELAWTCHDYADTLIERGERSDQAKTTELLEESFAISSELGMAPLVELVADLREQAASLPARTSVHPSGLTQREIEVLRLVSSGKTDREIGEELFISIKTVGNHVSKILNKTATANRTEAATYATLNGLNLDPGESGDVG